MIPRLHHEAPLAAGALSALTREQSHYLKAVLRREAGAALTLFNARDGDHAATIAQVAKAGVAVRIGEKLRAAAPEPDLALYFAPVKRAPVELIVQKGTELGVGVFAPVVTDRTNFDRLRTDRLRAIAIEAAEQSGRFSIPRIREPARLADALLHWPAGLTLLYCDEAGDDPEAEWGGPAGRAAPLFEVVRTIGQGPAAILIGPEGGFAPAERAWLRALPFVRRATLGPRILRADTAAIAAVTLWQAAVGDLARA